jgi:hypothetical protein
MMKKNFDEIIRELVNEITHIADNMTARNQTVSKIEIDLILEKLRKGYDELLHLDLAHPEVENKEMAKEPEISENLRSAKIDDEIHKSESETSEIDTDELMLEIGNKQLLKKPKPESQADLFAGQHFESKPGEKESQVSDEVEEKQAVDDSSSVGEKIQKDKQEETVADKIQKNKISSLKIAIGINEKFFFINELFNGSLKDYNEAIDKLDQAGNKNEAVSLLDAMQNKNMWDRDSEAYNQILQMVERKFV